MTNAAKRVLVTGGAGGIGVHMTHYFAGQKGAKVAVLDKNVENIEKMKIQLSKQPYFSNLIFVECDVTVEEQIKQSCKSVIQQFGGLDALVNNAGIASPWMSGGSEFNPIEDATLDTFNLYLRTNLTSAFLFARELAEELGKSHGCIVNISSIRGLQSQPNQEGYAAAKAGLIGLTHALASSLAPRRIRVNCISPGRIDVRDARLHEIDQFPNATTVTPLGPKSIEQHWAGRVGEGADIAKWTWRFIEDDDGFCTGQEITIDGGASKRLFLSNLHD